MSLKKHYWKVYCEIAIVCGSALLLMTIYMQLAGVERFPLDALWRIVLLSSAVVLRGASLINYHELDDGSMRLNYMISSILSDVLLITLLLYFTPGGEAFANQSWIILAVYLVLKGLFYFMNYLQLLLTAREINTRLRSTGGE